jgi:hypothetical protein
MVQSEPFLDPEGQYLLRLSSPPCAGCRYGQDGRCSGPQTVESLLPNQGNLLSCFDTERTMAVRASMERRRSAEPVQFPTILGLPPGIPVLCSGIPKGTRLNPNRLYGISLSDLLDDYGHLKYDSGPEMRRAFRLPPNARVCLLASVQDDRLEVLWEESDTRAVWKRIRRLGFEFATGFTHSVFERHSRNGQLLNQDRNLLTVELLAREGIPVVPVVCAVVEEDLRFVARWLDEHPSLSVIAGWAQGWKTDKGFKRFLGRMKFLKEELHRPIRFLIVGSGAADRIRTLYRELQSVTVANTNFVLRGVHGQEWDQRQLRFVPAPPEVSTTSLVPANSEDLYELCEQCAQEVAGAA